MKRSRHHIVGSEAGQNRPLAYMRRGHTRRPGRRGPALLMLVLVPAAVLGAIFLARLLG